MLDPYIILGLGRSASEADIKSAFRQLAKKYHPDHNGEKPSANQKFVEIKNAYEILGDRHQRARYDGGEIDSFGRPLRSRPAKPSRSGRKAYHSYSEFKQAWAQQNGVTGRNFDDLLKQMFGGRSRKESFADTAGPLPTPIKHHITITLEDLARGKLLRAKLPTGKLTDLDLPHDILKGQYVRVPGSRGHEPDIMVTFSIAPHKLFSIENDNLRMELTISLDEAVLGAKIQLPTLYGPVALTLPADTNGDQTIRLRERGLPKSSGRGDLFVSTRIVLNSPKDSDLELLMRRWRLEERPSVRGRDFHGT